PARVKLAAAVFALERSSVGNNSARWAPPAGTRANVPNEERKTAATRAGVDVAVYRAIPPPSPRVSAAIEVTLLPKWSARRPPMKNPRPPTVPPARRSQTVVPVSSPIWATRRSVVKDVTNVPYAEARNPAIATFQKREAHSPWARSDHRPSTGCPPVVSGTRRIKAGRRRIPILTIR